MTKKETEVKTETTAEVKPEQTTAKKNFDFKAEAKKAWDAFVRFIKPLTNLEKEIFAPKLEGFFKDKIGIIYSVGCVLMLVFAVFSLSALPSFGTVLGNWLVIAVVFVLFRLLCEIISEKPAKKK